MLKSHHKKGKEMTDEEQDTYLIEILNNILKDTQECLDYVKDLKTAEYKEIQADYKHEIKILTKVLKNCKGLDDMAECDEDVLGEIFQYLESYADNFIIDHSPARLKADTEEYEKIEAILNLFYDDDEDDEDGDFEDSEDESEE